MRIRNVMPLSSLVVLAALSLMSVGNAKGATIAGVTATASDTFSTTNVPASRTTDGSGLTGLLHGNATKTNWITNIASATVVIAEQWIQWDLGDLYVLDSVHVWNGNQNISGTGNDYFGIDQLDIYVSSEATPGDPEGAGAADWTVLKSDAAFSAGPGSTNYAGFDLETEISVSLPTSGIRWVRFEVDSIHPVDTQRVTMAEIRFDGTLAPTVPEPSALVLAVMGALGMGLACYRRRSRR